MRIAIPVVNGLLCQHFGHCELFAVVDVDDATRQMGQTLYHAPPPHEPGVLPKWLHEEVGANVILAGGMGMRARQLFDAHGIDVIVGVPGGAPHDVVQAYLDGTLESGVNTCDH